MNFDKLIRYIDSLDKRCIPARDIIIMKDHQMIFRHFSGFSDYGNTVPMNGNELYWLYSTSKIYTCTCVLQLIERGSIGLDDPVAKYLPEFAALKVRDGKGIRPAKTVLTIRYLMSMQGGLNYDLAAPSLKQAAAFFGENADTRSMIANLSHEPLEFDPGTEFRYSLCHDVLAAVVEVVSGMPFSEYMKKNIFDPLGIRELSFYLADENRSRVCAQYMYHPETDTITAQQNQTLGFQLGPKYESGGAGLIGNGSEYILLLDALACGGTGAAGARILKPESIDLFRTPQLCPKAKEQFDTWNREGYSYALGVRTLIDPAKSRSPFGEFGWDGAAGAYALIDPVNHLSIFYTQHVLGMGFVYSDCHPKIRDLVYEALEL